MVPSLEVQSAVFDVPNDGGDCSRLGSTVVYVSLADALLGLL
jgi:hypothetical protein